VWLTVVDVSLFAYYATSLSTHLIPEWNRSDASDLLLLLLLCKVLCINSRMFQTEQFQIDCRLWVWNHRLDEGKFANWCCVFGWSLQRLWTEHSLVEGEALRLEEKKIQSWIVLNQKFEFEIELNFIDLVFGFASSGRLCRVIVITDCERIR